LRRSGVVLAAVLLTDCVAPLGAGRGRDTLWLGPTPTASVTLDVEPPARDVFCDVQERVCARGVVGTLDERLGVMLAALFRRIPQHGVYRATFVVDDVTLTAPETPREFACHWRFALRTADGSVLVALRDRTVVTLELTDSGNATDTTIERLGDMTLVRIREALRRAPEIGAAAGSGSS
jgi:hypothetical protein